MKILPKAIIKVPLKGLAKIFEPDVFIEANNYCALYGKNPQEGIFGCGQSVEEALTDWEDNLHKALRSDIEIKRILLHKKPPPKVESFLEKYRQDARKDGTGYNINKNY
ncbi:MAG: hypothetical protein EOP55_19515 [Sphingobacteriales bacterium]|nr:MAG: hypothetical protein EOP55_19515 [Sphingobacteriales bacterium]